MQARRLTVILEQSVQGQIVLLSTLHKARKCVILAVSALTKNVLETMVKKSFKHLPNHYASLILTALRKAAPSSTLL